MKKCLILNADHTDWPKGYGYIFLGQWCLENLDDSLINQDMYETVKIKAKNIDEMNNRFHMITKAYKMALSLISKNLNKIHKINFSEKSWEIIVGPWLKQTLGIIAERYRSIEIALDNYEFDFVQVSKTCDISNASTAELVKTKNRKIIEFWNYNICSKIIYYISDKKKFIKKNKELKNESTKFYQKLNFKLFIKKIFIFVTNFFNQHSKFTIYKLNLSFFNQLKLFFYLRQIPKIIEASNYKYKKIDRNLRKDFFFQYTEVKNFENFILSIMPDLLPTDFVENFEYIKKNSLRLNNYCNSKAIITSYGFTNDEVFKTWLSFNSNKLSYFVFQHGNNYFTNKNSHQIQADLDLTDKFFSWGEENGSRQNVVPFYNLNNFGLNRINMSTNNKIFIYARGINSVRFRPWDDYDGVVESFFGIKELINNLDDSLKKFCYLKLYPHNDEKFKKKIFNEILNEKINILPIQTSKKNIYKESKIIVQSGDTSAFLETLSANIPTITYIKNFDLVRDSAVDDYEKLKKVGIIFDNPVNLAKHINENYKNINKWWDNKAVIDARENFVKKYSRKTPKNLNLLKSMAQILNSSLNDSFESNEK
jgi:putative transferase (TIGR04331 family)